MPIENNLPKTFNKLKESIGLDKIEMKEIKYCPECNAEIADECTIRNGKSFSHCSNTSCRELKINNYDSFFFVDIEPQLKDLIEINFEIINKYSNETRDHLDLIDGSYYNMIRKENTLHLMVFSDGTPIKKSTYKQFWPVFVGICELPRSMRESIRNKILSGIWYGRKKPNSDILFEKLVDEIKSINRNGIQITRNNQNYSIMIQLYGFLGDSPGRALFLNMKQFNGHYGCPLCLTPGKKIFLLV